MLFGSDPATGAGHCHYAMQELQAIVSRAALQSPEAAQQLPEEVFWFATQPKDRLKWNLLSPGAFPWLKPFLRRSVTLPRFAHLKRPFLTLCMSSPLYKPAGDPGTHTDTVTL